MASSALRVPNTGAGVWLAGAALLLVPLVWLWPGSHPLATATRFDVCAAARAASLTARLGTASFGKGASPGHIEERACALAAPSATGTAGMRLAVAVETQASLRRLDPRIDMPRWLERHIAEIAASSGGRPQALKGPWKEAVVIAGVHASHELSIVAADEGIVVTLRIQELAADTASSFMRELARELRRLRPD